MWKKLALASITMAVNIWMIVYFSDNNPAPFLPADRSALEQETIQIKSNNPAVRAELVRYDHKGR